METSTEPVCGLVRADLVRQIVGDAPIDSKPVGPADDGGDSAQCQIANADTNQIVMQLAIGSVDPTEWGPKLEREAKAESGYGDLAKRYTGNPGMGYGLTYESGIYAQGASVYVIQGDLIIRATVYNWIDASPEERLALAEDVARDMRKNFSDVSPG